MKYPIGTQTFSKMIEKGLVYVDKTDLMYELAEHNTVFLCRPRRFGKSLLLSTMKSYFRGERELFAGLKIEEIEAAKPAGKQWIKRPVLTIDLNMGEYTNATGLTERLNRVLEENERAMGLEIANERPCNSRFANLIMSAHEKSGQKVVILVDEYDKPMTETMNMPELHEQNRDLLRSFYGALKTYDEYIHFTLLTGVTKFSKLGIFSDLNMLEDVSLDPQFATICGITEGEIDSYFAEEVEALADENMMSCDEARLALRRTYNGYHFLHTAVDGVYNPFSLLNALSKRSVDYFWNSTGSSMFLGPMLQKSSLDVMDLEWCTSNKNELMEYRAGDTNVIPLLYQAGYLTIKGFDRMSRMFSLGFPNDEVRAGFVKMIKNLKNLS